MLETTVAGLPFMKPPIMVIKVSKTSFALTVLLSNPVCGDLDVFCLAPTNFH